MPGKGRGFQGCGGGAAPTRRTPTLLVDLIIKQSPGTGWVGTSVTLEQYAGDPRIRFTPLRLCGTVARCKDGVLLFGGVVSKGSCHAARCYSSSQVGLDGHWRSLTCAVRLLCMAMAILIHRLVICSQSCPGESKRILAQVQPLNKEPPTTRPLLYRNLIRLSPPISLKRKQSESALEVATAREARARR